MDYTIRLANKTDVANLSDIEVAAAQQFLPYLDWLKIPVDILEGLVTQSFLQKAQMDKRLWIATIFEQDIEKPVGFIVAKFLLESCFIVELSVHSGYVRMGIGSALVKACCEGARDRGFRQISLTTFRKVPWNIPFYQRLGFEVLPAKAWSQEIRAIVEHEARYGFLPEKRAVMSRILPPLTSGYWDRN